MSDYGCLSGSVREVIENRDLLNNIYHTAKFINIKQSTITRHVFMAI